MTGPGAPETRRERSRARRVWRGASGALTAGLTAVAVGAAVQLGATGPLVSPVQAPVAAAAVDVQQDAVAGPDDGGGRGPRSARADGGRPDGVGRRGGDGRRP